MATVANQRALLKRDLSSAAEPQSRKKRAFIETAGTLGAMTAYGAFIAGAVLWWPSVPIILGTGAGAGLVAALRRRQPIAAVDILPIATGARAVTRTGIAHRLAETVPSITQDGSVLAEEIVITNKKGVLFRRVRAAPFVVELDGGGKLVVFGPLRVETPTGKPEPIKKNDVRAVALGLEDLPLKGMLHASAVREGARIAVTGEEAQEIVPELAFHRDAGESGVMRGRAKAIVAVRAAKA